MTDFPLTNNYYKQSVENDGTILSSRAASDSFTTNPPKIRAIRTTKQIGPFNYLFKPLDPAIFSQNNNGICVKVIEYVLEINKGRLTDQCSESSQDAANSSKCSIDTITGNNYDRLQIHSIPNEQNSLNQAVNYVRITNKCMPSVPTNIPQLKNETEHDKSGYINGFSKTIKQESFTNIDQNVFPQISNSIGTQHTSSFAKYSPRTLHAQIVPTNILQFKNQTEYYKSGRINDFGKTMEQESFSNIDQNVFPQISNSTGKQHVSSFAKYPPKTLHTQIVPTNILQFKNQTEYDKSGHINGFGKTMEQESFSNINQNVFPQISNSIDKQHVSSYANYSPRTLHAQIVPTNTLQFKNQTEYDKSGHINGFGKTMEQESFSNINQNVFPQISNSIGKQHVSSFEKYSPRTLHTQIVPTNILQFKNQTKYDKSGCINGFGKTMEQESFSNNNQNVFPQISNSIGKQHVSSFGKYSPRTLHAQIVPTNVLQFKNQTKYDKSGCINGFGKTMEQESFSNIDQNVFPQKSNSIGKQHVSSFGKYSPRTLHAQIYNQNDFEVQNETNTFYPHYDTSMVPSSQVANETQNHSSLLKNTMEFKLPAYRMCNPSSHNTPLTQFSPVGNFIKPGIPKLSAHEVGDELGICPVILHPNKQLSSQVQMKSEALIKTIGFAPARSQMTAQAQSRIVTTSLQRSIMESQNVSPLIITPSSHVIHSANEIVPAKIVPLPPAPAVSHFSVINKTGSYDSIPEYTGIRQSLVSGTPPVYTQSDFARFPPKSYHHKNAVINPAVIHGPIPGNIDEPCINIPNSQHVFKPIISPRPSILRKRDADGVLRAQKNLIPILTKPDIEECQNIDETPLNRNGYSETGLQIESIMVPQIPEVRLLPQIAALTRQSHIMVEISPRKKPRKQLLPVTQEGSPLKLVCDDMEYVDEKLIKNEKSEDFPDDDLICNDDLIDGDAEDEAEDDLDDMDVDDDCPADDDYDDDDDDFGNDFVDDFDYVKSDKTFFEDVKTSVEASDESSACIKPKNKRPTLLGSYKNTWRGHTHHFQRYTDFKIKETKKQLADMQQAKKWTSDSISGWRVRHLLNQFDGMINIEEEIITRMTELISEFEANIKDPRLCHTFVELVKDNIQRSIVSRAQLDEIRQQLKKIFDYKPLTEDVADKYCPKDLKKKNAKVFNLSKS